MQNAVVLLVLLLIKQSSAWVPYVCPEVFKTGIPLEVYGGPLFPVAIVISSTSTVIEPFWVTLSGGYTEELLLAIAHTELAQCIRVPKFFCQQKFQEVFGRKHNALFDYDSDGQYKNHINNKTDPEIWGPEPLDDYTSIVLLTRRSILISCLFWCHAISTAENKEFMPEICPNPCDQPGVCTEHGTIPGSCEMTGQGFFTNQYRCRCVENYIWNEMMHLCTHEDPCKRDTPVCAPDGTISCSYDAEFNVSRLLIVLIICYVSKIMILNIYLC